MGIQSDNVNVVECEVCADQILQDVETGEFISEPCSDICPCKESYDALRLDYDIDDEVQRELRFDE